MSRPAYCLLCTCCDDGGRHSVTNDRVLATAYCGPISARYVVNLECLKVKMSVCNLPARLPVYCFRWIDTGSDSELVPGLLH